MIAIRKPKPFGLKWKRNSRNKRLVASLLVLILSLISFFITSCHPTQHHTVIRSFYYWKTNFNLSKFEDSALNSLQVQKLYVRFFDVDLDTRTNKPQPKAIINFGKNIPENKQLVPVVFITPRALSVINFQNLDFYVENIANLLSEKAKLIHLNPEEIQIDCDWTASNKDVYFELLRRLHRQPFFKNKIMSATIRLHQVKFITAQGIPPVDKGLLMVYNMDPLSDFKVENSIISLATVKKYLDNIGSYPLKLEVALPIYSWTLLFENSTLKGILRDVEEKDLLSNNFFKPLSDHRFQIVRDTVFKNYPLRKGSQIRVESSPLPTLLKTADYLSSKISQDTLTLALYHCDSINFTHYQDHELEKIYNHFR